MKPQPNAGLVEWLSNVDEDRVFISVVTLTEIRYGIERMAAGSRRKNLEEWLQHELPMRFDGRILPVDETVADSSGRVAARRDAAGPAMGAIYAFLAAPAEGHPLTALTRNQPDF